MKSLMIPISFICYLIFVSCEVNDLNDYTADATTIQEEQIDTVSAEQTTPPTSEEAETEEANPSEPESEDPPQARECITNGGLAGDSGLKVWCWEDVELPIYSGSKGVSFSDKQLVIDSECYEQQVTKSGNRLKFRVDPLGPEIGSWCERNYNMRAEIRTAPWQIRHALGTEEWFGWSYTFGDDYVIDQYNQWKFFQIYPGPVGLSAHISMEIIHKDQYRDHLAGEIYIINNGARPDRKRVSTGIRPKAGETLDIVVHVIWGDSSEGLLQIWINEILVYDEQDGTVTEVAPWGGNAKWGIYKWPWKDEARVQQSLDQNITHLETFIGPIRMITRKPGDSDYGTNSFSVVSPR